MNVFLIAGEHSGDSIGASLIESLRAASSDTIEFSGIGGSLMEEKGMECLLPLEELSVMGILEVLPRLPKLYKVYKKTIEEIEKRDPDVVITIDFPDFNFFVAKALKKRGKTKAKIVHYVAPTVWAWRPERAKQVAKFLDGMICLYPFEPEYFKKHKLRSIFVGHPITEHPVEDASGQHFRIKNNISADTPICGLFFGSRDREFKALAPVIKDAAVLIKAEIPNIHFLAPTLPDKEYELLKALEGFDFPVTTSTSAELKWDAFKACDAAIAVSGTVGLELAYAGVPHIIAYKVNPVTWEIVKRMVKIEHAHLANIIAKKTVVPEFLQKDCEFEKIAEGVLDLLQNQEVADKQRRGFEKIHAQLENDYNVDPSKVAAKFILKIAGK